MNPSTQTCFVLITCSIFFLNEMTSEDLSEIVIFSGSLNDIIHKKPIMIGNVPYRNRRFLQPPTSGDIKVALVDVETIAPIVIPIMRMLFASPSLRLSNQIEMILGMMVVVIGAKRPNMNIVIDMLKKSFDRPLAAPNKPD